MYTLQLGDNLFTDLDIGDIFIYKYSQNHFAIKHVEKDFKPELNEFTVEILSLSTHRHFIFKRDNGYYWWEEKFKEL